MSYILEALRKSEEERNRGDVPTITQPIYGENPVQQQKTSAKWIVIVVLLLAVNLLVAMFWLGTQFQGGDGKIVAQPVEETSERETQPINKVVKKVAQVQPQQSELIEQQTAELKEPVPAPIKKTASAADVKPKRSEPTQYEMIKPKRFEENRTSTIEKTSPAESIARLVRDEHREEDYTDLPYLSELSSRERSGMPSLDFSSHMFSSNPQSRSVIINGARYREHENLTQDLSIHAITQEGVVFDWKHALYRVNIMQQWTIE